MMDSERVQRLEPESTQQLKDKHSQHMWCAHPESKLQILFFYFIPAWTETNFLVFLPFLQINANYAIPFKFNEK